MSSERTMWQWLSEARMHHGSRLHLCRMENLAGTGAADVEGMLDGKDLNIELKMAPKRPVRGGPLRFGSPLRDSQRRWGKARWEAGGSYCFLIQVGSGSERVLYLVRGTPENIDDLYLGVNEDWCAAHNELDKPWPARVVFLATQMRRES